MHKSSVGDELRVMVTMYLVSMHNAYIMMAACQIQEMGFGERNRT